jgi:hypothetical protein
VCAVVLTALSAPVVDGDNVQINLAIDPPDNGVAYQTGEEIHVAVRLRSETVPIASIYFMQIDLDVLGATLVDHDGDGLGDMQWAPFGPDGLAGTAATTNLGSVNPPGGPLLLFWFTALSNPAAYLNLTAADPGREFINFDIVRNTPGPVTIDALGPCINDESSTGAFAIQSSPPGNFENCDADATRNIVQAVLPGAVGTLTPNGFQFNVVPEPAVALLALTAIGCVRRRRR